MAEPDFKENPLTKLADIIGGVITGYNPFLEAIGGASAMQLFDRPHDIRGDMAKSGLRHAAAMEPQASVLDFDGSNTDVYFTRRFHFTIYNHTSTDRRPCEYFEWLIWKVVAFLNDKQDTDGEPITFPEELNINTITVQNTAPENMVNEYDNEGWENVCDIVVAGFVSFATLKAN